MRNIQGVWWNVANTSDLNITQYAKKKKSYEYVVNLKI